MIKYHIDPDIRRAETLPGSFYSNEEVFESLKTKVFAKSWHWIGSEFNILPSIGSVYPTSINEEPILIVKDKNGEINCLSNVCTHRGNIIAHHPAKVNHLSCMYHGRRFDLDGAFKYMPEFQEAEDFPRPCDSLHRFNVGSWFSHLFVSLEPAFDFSSIINVLSERVGFLPVDMYKLDNSHSKDYLVNSHWALYCDNYLEGFHIPFVHNDLNAALDYGQYETKIYDHVNLQIGYTDSGQEHFELPEGHPDKGRFVAAYYYWIFPNIMLNFYPWGLSINVVKPLSINKTKVSFISFVYDESKLGEGAGAVLDKVEREDEFVVEGVHSGLKSKYYQSGRFSPNREKGVHHFQRLLAKYLAME